jgi:hypothetical protein
VESTLDSLMLGFSVALRPDVLWYGFLGCVVGTLVGVLPGIGPLSGISILLPVTFGLDATKAIVMLAGIYYGSQYGGSTTSILMRIPGEASSVMTCIDGYAMARKGRAGAALCIAAVGSWIAGTFGVVMRVRVSSISVGPTVPSFPAAAAKREPAPAHQQRDDAPEGKSPGIGLGSTRRHTGSTRLRVALRRQRAATSGKAKSCVVDGGNQCAIKTRKKPRRSGAKVSM